MNWPTTLALAAAVAIVLLILLRVEARARWVVWVFLVAPAIFVLWAWATFLNHWPETLAGLGLAGVGVGLWWWFAGRKLPPTASNVKVWGQEDPPKPKAADLAAMQAEILRLKDEKLQMEAELRKLKGTTPEEKNQ